MNTRTIALDCFLVVKLVTGRYGLSKPSARLTSKTPSLSAGEIAVRLDVRLPESLFVRPSLSAVIAVSDADAPPAVITAEVASNIAQVIQESMGISMHITADGPKG